MAINKYVKFVRGSSLAFNNLVEKDIDTLYFITDTDSGKGSLFLGDKLISGIADLNDLESVLIKNVSNNQILVYDETEEKWINKTINAAIGLMTGASATEQGGAGLVPAPGIGQQDYFLRGDGTWAPITVSDNTHVASSTQVFEVVTNINESHENAIARVSDGFSIEKGDIVIVKDLIATEKYQYTAYVYNGEQWAAMDGNYRADNVYFDEDFTFTKAIGTVTIPSSGSKKVSAAGKNLQEFFAGLFAEEEYPTPPSTSASLSSNNIGAHEVGTNIAITYSFSTNANAYKYGPANGVTWSNYKATFNGETLTIKSGTFKNIQVTDDTNLKITGSVDQSAGTIPVTNLGNEYSSAQIKAKSWTGLETSALTGYRAWFCGYKDGDTALADPTAITGDQIRSLGNSANGSWKSSMDITKMKQMFFAAPAGSGYKPAVKDAATTAPQTVLGPITVYVKGANNYMAADEIENGGMAYDVWYVANADAASGSATVNITQA